MNHATARLVKHAARCAAARRSFRGRESGAPIPGAASSAEKAGQRRRVQANSTSSNFCRLYLFLEFRAGMRLPTRSALWLLSKRAKFRRSTQRRKDELVSQFLFARPSAPTETFGMLKPRISVPAEVMPASLEVVRESRDRIRKPRESA